MLLLSCSTSKSANPPPTATVAPVGEPPAGKLPEGAAPKRYALELTIDPEKERFRGRTRIELELERPTAHVWLHGKDLDVSSAAVLTPGGETVAARYEQKLPSGVALVSFERPIAGSATLEIGYEAPFDTSLNGLYRVEREGLAYTATQFQPIAARKVFPGFDEPRFKVPFDITLNVPEEAVAITTTPETERERAAGGLSKRTFATTKPLPTYLLAFAVGPYDVNDFGALPPNAVRERPLRLRAATGRGLGERATYALESTGGLLTLLEQYFGSPYPYLKLDLITPPENFGGAMENVGAIIYGEFLLLLDEDSPLDQRRAHTYVHAHEMAHMWFGNLVTPKWWDDLWLNESFASWMMYEIADAYWPEGGFEREILSRALSAMAADSLASARQIREPVKENEAISDAFDAITYQKGGGVLAMLEAYAGEEEFREGVRLHMKRFAHGVADADDFMRSLAEGSGQPELEPAFRSFIEQPGVPLLTVETRCLDEGSAEVRLRQTRYAPLGSTIEPEAGQWTIPVCLRADASRSCLVLTERETVHRLDTCPERLHPNADGAGYYRFSMDEAGWAQLTGTASELPAAEALVFGDSLDASFRAGRLGAENLVSGLAALAEHPAWDVTKRALGDYEELVEELLEGTPSEAAAKRLGKAWFRPRYDALEGASTADAILLRGALHRFLVIVAEDEALRAELVPLARRYVGLGGEPDPSAVDPDLLETTLSVGVQEVGRPFVEKLTALVTSTQDPAVRSAAAGALGRTEDAEISRALLADILAERFPVQVSLQILFRQLFRPATREATLAWLEEHARAVFELVPGTFRSNVAGLGRGFCTAEKAEAWKALVEKHAEILPGFERSLAQALESIRLCAELKEKRGPALAELIEARAPRAPRR